MKSIDPSPQNQTLFTVEEAAECLKVTQEYLRRLLRRGRIHGHKFGADWRVPAQEISRIVAGGLDGPPLPPSIIAGSVTAPPEADVVIQFMVDDAEASVWLRVPVSTFRSIVSHHEQENAKSAPGAVGVGQTRRVPHNSSFKGLK